MPIIQSPHRGFLAIANHLKEPPSFYQQMAGSIVGYQTLLTSITWVGKIPSFFNLNIIFSDNGIFLGTVGYH